MQALLLGSIGVLSDTSELQREAFNTAFERHGLDWSWDRDAYREMLTASGGTARIAVQATEAGVEIDAAAVHATKSALFQEMLAQGRATLRPGVRAAMDLARGKGARLGFVTTTGRDNVDALLAALDIPPAEFDLITSRDDVTEGKPAPEVYHLACERLDVSRTACVAVEDNVDGARAANAAGIPCLVWPNANTAGHDFGDLPRVGDSLLDALPGAPVAAQ
ncbi:HAD-IA family hydrolase [Jannaschia marina]|uniref:HAD-IA family hydrolase n=1 Tax=Jannaschia marina TaxID=2741674 RepID=UPI001ABA94EB|nr:HAD-IA family hydrolase [Jannaschia marina]